MATTFSYTHPDVDANTSGNQPATFNLNLRFSPYSVQWDYNLNTQTYDTYGGQVTQILSVNIDNLIIEGQLGREGPFGRKQVSQAQTDPRYGGPVPAGGWAVNSVSDQFNNYRDNPNVGLYGMVEFFREYFALVSQGGDANVPGRYLQVPMYLYYDGAQSDEGSVWQITPTSFPSFLRSNENFAPQWRVEAQVIQAPLKLKTQLKESALARLQEAVGYRVPNPFSDPLADPSGSGKDLVTLTNQIASKFQALIPDFSNGELDSLVWNQVSLPAITPFPGVSNLNPREILQNEVGLSAGALDSSATNPTMKPLP